MWIKICIVCDQRFQAELLLYSFTSVNIGRMGASLSFFGRVQALPISNLGPGVDWDNISVREICLDCPGIVEIWLEIGHIGFVFKYFLIITIKRLLFDFRNILVFLSSEKMYGILDFNKIELGFFFCYNFKSCNHRISILY